MSDPSSILLKSCGVYAIDVGYRDRGRELILYCGEVAIVAEVRVEEIGSAEVRRAGRILCDKINISFLNYELLLIDEKNLSNSSNRFLLIYFVCRYGCRHVVVIEFNPAQGRTGQDRLGSGNLKLI